MNGTAGQPGSPAKAEADLGRLNRQVAAMRAVLVQLLQDVVVAETRLELSQASLLVAANENLILAALDAQTNAETAHDALDEASRVSGLDPLTGLPNRTVLLDRLETALSYARRHGNRVAVLFVDLDGFKLINDSFGHAAGDDALQWVADCLKSLVRETDTVSRHGGDEFLVLLTKVAQAEDAVRVAAKVNAALAAYQPFDGSALRLRASIGISLYPEDGPDAKTLIACADEAMYLAKKQTRGGVVVHHQPLRGLNVPRSEPVPDPRPQHEPAPLTVEERHRNLRDANESLVLAALGAQELLDAAMAVRKRQSDLMALVANELRDPFAPIRVTAAALGIPDAETTLLARVQAVVEEQADKMAHRVRQLLERDGLDPRHDAG